MSYTGNLVSADQQPIFSALALLQNRDQVVDRLVAYAQTCKSIRGWASQAGVSEAIVRKMRQGEVPKLETLAALEKAMPAEITDSSIAVDLAYFEEVLNLDGLSDNPAQAELLGRALELWRNNKGNDYEIFRASLDEAGVSRRMTSVRFDQSGLLQFAFLGQNMGKLNSTYLHRPVRHLVNTRMAHAAESRMLKADMQDTPQVSRISFGMPGEGIVRCFVLNLPFVDKNGHREVINVSARF